MMNKKTHNKYLIRFKQKTHLLCFGKFGIKMLSFNQITQSQLATFEWIINKKIKKINNKNCKIWNLVLLNYNLTKLNLESRMGKGKGSIYTKSFFLKPGKIIFEFDNIKFSQMIFIFNFFKNFFPGKICLVYRY